ncbi:MAG: hypothetical protein QOF06_759 [Solirubrobacterales bacterium]|jgi:aminoglycoside phosphotransferase (APT) family kinase protein|nr:hypothetical protein [Solirubrobacterales bacterium]
MSDEPALRALQDLLREAGLAPIVGFERRPSPFRTSFPIEEIDLELGDGERLRLVSKRLDRAELSPDVQLVKPRFLHDPEREPEVYRAVLPRGPVGPPRSFGSAEVEGGRLLFVEWVEGRELFQVGERELWEEAARWLARFHGALAPEAERCRVEARLIDHDASFYRRWIERARQFASPGGRSGAKEVGWLAERHDQVVAGLLALPRTVVHGEFYASNVLVADTRVAPVDWELAAVGPGLTDVAALVSGWPAADREAIAAAYAAEASTPEFSERDLAFARLQVAIQWLGWAPPQWEPPEGQRHDWLGEAVALAEELGL